MPISQSSLGLLPSIGVTATFAFLTLYYLITCLINTLLCLLTSISQFIPFILTFGSMITDLVLIWHIGLLFPSLTLQTNCLNSDLQLLPRKITPILCRHQQIEPSWDTASNPYLTWSFMNILFCQSLCILHSLKIHTAIHIESRTETWSDAQAELVFLSSS